MKATNYSSLADGSIVHNITTRVDPSIEEAWIEWQKNEHIPEIMKTSLFNDHKFFRLLEQDDSDGIIYVIQFFSSSIDNYKRYIEEFASLLNQRAVAKWRDQFVSFDTVMEIVN